MRSPRARYEFKRENFKQRILRRLNLEDTPRNHLATFAIERLRGVPYSGDHLETTSSA
jgi:hypothetical protein